MNNVLFVNKPSGITSFDVCFKLRKVLKTKRIGHTGTLDPLAKGVMVVLFDKATKANQFLTTDTKTYEAHVTLGVQTDTLDITGSIVMQKDCVLPAKEILINTLNSYLGKSKQIVPLTSAVRINGKRLYEYQRENIEVELPSREIEIFEIELLTYDTKDFSFKVKVSSGTYIRSLVRDILNDLNLVGTLKDLIRTDIDDISINDCDNLEDILNGNYKTHNLYDILKNKYETFEATNIDDIKNGKRIKIDSIANRILISYNNEAIAIYEKDDQEYKMVRGLW